MALVLDCIELVSQYIWKHIGFNVSRECFIIFFSDTLKTVMAVDVRVLR